jgi:hypothetical protein
MLLLLLLLLLLSCKHHNKDTCIDLDVHAYRLCNGTPWLGLCGCTQRLACCCRYPAGLKET